MKRSTDPIKCQEDLIDGFQALIAKAEGLGYSRVEAIEALTDLLIAEIAADGWKAAVDASIRRVNGAE